LDTVGDMDSIAGTVWATINSAVSYIAKNVRTISVSAKRQMFAKRFDELA